MAVDNKYGRVTVEHKGPDEDEPVIVFRAQDRLTPNVLRFYYEECQRNGSPQHHLDVIEKTLNDILDWQGQHSDRVRVPNSDRYVERIAAEGPSS